MIRIVLFLLLLVPFTASAIEIRSFDNEEKRQRYEKLIEELRCLVCQNQSLADSEAELAKDLRDEVYGILQQGKTEEEAIRFLTDRYGDFVLYRPPFKLITLLLWGGPLLIFLAGVGFIWKRNLQCTESPSLELTEEEQKRLEQLKKKLESKI